MFYCWFQNDVILSEILVRSLSINTRCGDWMSFPVFYSWIKSFQILWKFLLCCWLTPYHLSNIQLFLLSWLAARLRACAVIYYSKLLQSTLEILWHLLNCKIVVIFSVLGLEMCQKLNLESYYLKKVFYWSPTSISFILLTCNVNYIN